MAAKVYQYKVHVSPLQSNNSAENRLFCQCAAMKELFFVLTISIKYLLKKCWSATQPLFTVMRQEINKKPQHQTNLVQHKQNKTDEDEVIVQADL